MRIASSVRIEVAQAVADRHAEFVAIDAGQGCQDIDRRVRDQRRVMLGKECAAVLHEVEQVRHLLEVGRHIWVVAPQMHIVELEINHPLYLVADALKITALCLTACVRRQCRHGAKRYRQQ